MHYGPEETMDEHSLVFSCNEKHNILCIMHERYDTAQIIPQTNSHIINGAAASCATWAFKSKLYKDGLDEPQVSLVLLGATTLWLCSIWPLGQNYNRVRTEIITFLSVAPVIMTMTPQRQDYRSVCSDLLLLAHKNLFLYVIGQRLTSVQKVAWKLAHCPNRHSYGSEIKQ